MSAAAVTITVFVMVGSVEPAFAQTQGELTGEGPIVLDGVEAAELPNAFTYPGEEAVECPKSTYAGRKPGGGAIQPPATIVTLLPTYNNNTCHVGFRTSTIKTNGCHYKLSIGSTTSPEVYDVSADIVCPGENVMEIFVFFAGNNENIKVCTVTITSQSGLEGSQLRNKTDAEGNTSGTLGLEGAFEGIAAEKKGLCGSSTTEEAAFDVNLELSGTGNEAEEPTAVTITD